MHVDLHIHTIYVHTHTRMCFPTVRHLFCPHADHRAHMFLLSSFPSVRSASLQSSPIAQVSRRRLRVVWLSSAPCGSCLTRLESQASCLFNLQQAGLVSGAFLGSRGLLGSEPGAESKSRGILHKEGRGRVGVRTPNGQFVICPWTSGAPYRSRECRHLGSVWSFRPLVEACEREWIPILGAHSY